MDQQTILCYAFSTIAQVAAALAAFLAFLGLLRLDRLQDEANKAERALAGFIRASPLSERYGISPEGRERFRELASEDFLTATGHAVLRAWQIATRSESDVDPFTKALVIPVYRRWEALMAEQRWLIYRLALFIAVTLLLILAPAIIGLLYVNQLATWAGTRWWVYGASAWLGLLPAYTMWRVAQYMAQATRRRGEFILPE
jgi:hypothetical protein